MRTCAMHDSRLACVLKVVHATQSQTRLCLCSYLEVFALHIDWDGGSWSLGRAACTSCVRPCSLCVSRCWGKRTCLQHKYRVKAVQIKASSDTRGTDNVPAWHTQQLARQTQVAATLCAWFYEAPYALMRTAVGVAPSSMTMQMLLEGGPVEAGLTSAASRGRDLHMPQQSASTFDPTVHARSTKACRRFKAESNMLHTTRTSHTGCRTQTARFGPGADWSRCWADNTREC